MGIFRSLEKKLEGLVEGGFGRAFKATVQPVELAHKLAKEMGDHKTVGVAHIYVPNEYDVYLGKDDFEHLSSLGEALHIELANYLTAYARREGWTLVAPPRITLHRDDDLHVGEFGIATRTVAQPGAAAAESGPAAEPAAEPAAPAGGAAAAAAGTAAVAAGPAAAAVPGAAAAAPAPGGAPPPRTGPVDRTLLYEGGLVPAPGAAVRAFLRGAGGAWELAQPVTLIGRSRRCDVVLGDPNVSRQHAEVRRDGERFVLRDLGSTNGTRVNGREVRQAVLRHGDRIELATTELRFEISP